MKIQRIIKHLIFPGVRLKRAFSAEAFGHIEQAIAASELQHAAEIRFAVESALSTEALRHGQSAQARALDVFSNLRVWDTEANNGVLIYLLLADQDVEIVSDRAAHAKIGADAWRKICSMMEVSFQHGNFEAGVLLGIEAVTQHLVKHFPRCDLNAVEPNELPNAPVVLHRHSDRKPIF